MAKPSDSKKTSPLVKGLIVVVALMIVTFIFNNFDSSKVTSLFGFGSIEGKAEGSMQGAVEACRTEAYQELGAKLIDTDLDELSTRYNESSKLYLVFINLTIKGVETKAYYYECRVSAVNQKVLSAQLNSPPGEFQSITFP